MFQLFTEDCTTQYSVVKMPETDYIRRSYLRELLNIEDYYHHRVYAVKSNHLLNQLLYHLSAPADYDDFRFTEVVRSRAPYVANSFHLTSEIAAGKIHDGTFYGPGCPEILLAEDEYFAPGMAAANWKNICAVKPLLHPRSDMKLLFPNGRDVSTDKGLAVVTINLPLLAFQFRCFMKEQALKQNDSVLGSSHFVHMYVLPNMLYANTDLSVLNRAMNLFYGAPMGDTKFKHSFRIIDYTDRLDRVLERDLERLQNSSLPYEAMLRNLPGIVSTDMIDALRLPEVAPTRQVWWAMLVSRLSIIKFLIDLGGDKGISRNRADLSTFKRVLKRLQNENVLEGRLPTDSYHDAMTTIDEIMSL